MSALRARVLTLLAAVSCCGCPGEPGGGQPGWGNPGQRGGQSEAIAVAVEAARVETVREVLVSHAALEPEVLVEITAKTEGLLTDLHVEAGDVVVAGQTLARIDPTRATLRLREAELALALTQTSLTRVQGLAQRGLATTEEREQAKEAVAQAELTLESAKLDVSDTYLRSPIAGVITERVVDKGGRLQPGAVAFRVADRDPLLAKTRVPEADAERVRVGQAALVKIDGRAETIAGEVVRVAPLVDLGSGTVLVTVAISQGTAEIRLNRFATVEIVVAVREGAVTIPQAALALRGDEARILVCKDGVATGREIRVGVREGERVEVLDGLQPGEQVVVAAPDDLRDGTAVRVVGPGDAAPVGSPSEARKGPPGGPPGRRRPEKRE